MSVEQQAPKSVKQKIVEKPKSLFYWAAKQLKDQDAVCPSISTEIHIDNDEDQRTHIGGVLTILAKILLLWVIYSGGYKMVTRKSPYLQSNEILVPPEHRQVNRIRDMN